MSFVNGELLPHLRKLKDKPFATPRQRVISEVFSSFERTGVEEVIRVMVRVIDPEIGETVYDPCCGTGGFLAQAYQLMKHKANTGADIETLKVGTFYGREKENLVYPIALANLVLQEIDEPHIWHGNTLTGLEVYGGLFSSAPSLFDVVLTKKNSI